MKKVLKFVLLIISPVLFATGCGNSSADESLEPDPEASDGRIYLKEYDLEEAKALATGRWKTIPEGRYLTFSYAETIGEDSIYVPKDVQWEKNDYGYQWSARMGTLTDTIWLISFSKYHDTLHYASPGYPPLESWDAVKISEMEFEEKRQEVLFSRYLRDAACPPEAVSGSSLVYKIVGRWKLIKETGIDYSCDEIIYNFQPDSVLTITSDRPDYPASSANYSYDPCILCLFSTVYHPDAYTLTVDGKPVRSEVLEKIMFLGDEQNPSAKVFIRIN
ncbi:MAG: hypothetical protein LBP25_02635 [Tannerellaceae bacterium]|nr:hypothetical protein [Tannerellaceae bacterium]